MMKSRVRLACKKVASTFEDAVHTIHCVDSVTNTVQRPD